MLIAAIIWNRDMVARPAGIELAYNDRVVIANALMRGARRNVWRRLEQGDRNRLRVLLSPLVGFICAVILLLLMKFIIRKPELYSEPKGRSAPPGGFARFSFLPRPAQGESKSGFCDSSDSQVLISSAIAAMAVMPRIVRKLAGRTSMSTRFFKLMRSEMMPEARAPLGLRTTPYAMITHLHLSYQK
jgi:hypothetical protein